ncbi:MAG TPA: hypothetical protein VN345_16235 [Blastocatellia bacterium]|nr:hypothetical protein [Blastocatellia bacterium]
MRKIVFLALGFLLILVIGGGVLLSQTNSKSIKRMDGTGVPAVRGVAPVPEAAVAALLGPAFGKRSGAVKFGQFLLAAPGDPRFPDDYQLKAFSKDNPPLAEYVALDASARKQDFYVTPPYAAAEVTAGSTDYYWESEYYYNDKPAKFRCKFIIHLEPQGGSSTRIDVIEFQPEIWVGRKFDVLGHGGPGYYHDIRFVEPTTKDRIELLDYLKRILSGS